jgi:hypothetical protein
MPQQSWKEIRNKGNKIKKNYCSFKFHRVHILIRISGPLAVGDLVTGHGIEQSFDLEEE